MIDLDAAIRLRAEGKLEESNTILCRLAQENPDDPIAQYQCAWSFDVLGLERDAIPHYTNAIRLGLQGDDLRGAYLGLGSTYRTIGAYRESKAVFDEALQSFPDDAALQVFYAMTLYNLGEHAQSMKLLLRLVADPAKCEDVATYQKAICLYAEDLDRIW